MLATSWVKWSLAAVLAVGTIPAMAMAKPAKRTAHHATHKTTTHAPLRTSTPKLAAVSHTPARRTPAKPVHHTPVKKHTTTKKTTTATKHKTAHKATPVMHKTAAR